MGRNENQALGLEKRRPREEPGPKDGKRMGSALMNQIYSRKAQLSTHRVQSVPMAHIEVQQVFLRFQVGRATSTDRDRFCYWPEMTMGTFIDKNAVDLVES